MTCKPTTSLLVDAEKCTGCRLCEMACSMAHHGILNPGRARIRVLRFEGGAGNVPLVCQACEDAPCIKTCPMNTRRRRDSTPAIRENWPLIARKGSTYPWTFRKLGELIGLKS